MPRTIPQEVERVWGQLSHGPEGIGALATSRELHRAVARWQAELVVAALSAGASWENIGDALGTTRQAAWARFRHIVEEQGGSTRMDQQARVQQRLRELWTTGVDRMRSADAQWREEEDRLRQQVRDAHQELRAAKLRHSAEVRAGREELRHSAATLKAEIVRLKAPAAGPAAI